MTSILTNKFGVADWLVFSGLFVISAVIAIVNGVITRRKSTSTEEFLMGSHSVPLLPTAVSLMASFISSITILGYPADVYTLGAQYAFTPGGWMLGGVAILTLIVPLLHPLGMTSVYEYFELRYKSPILRRICACIGVLHQTMYIGMCIFGPATAMEAMVGFEAYKSVLIIGFLATIPTAIGGLKGVIWMDFFQGIIMYGALIAILTAGASEVGGFSTAVNTFAEHNSHVNSANGVSSFTWYGALIGNTFTWLGHMGVSQAGFQRYGALRTLNLSRIAVVLGLVIQATVATLSILCGVVIYAYFAGRGCDPIGRNLLESLNHLVPAMVQQVLDYPGVAGLFMASVFCGAYSSVTSSLTAISANLWEDALLHCLGHKGAKAQAIAVRVVILVAGVIGMGVAFGCLYAGGSIIQLALAFINAVTGPLVGTFLLCGFFPMANELGASVGVLVSLVLTLWLSIGSYVHVVSKVTLPPTVNITCDHPDFVVATLTSTVLPATTTVEKASSLLDFYSISYVWYGLFAALIVVVVGLIASLISMPILGKSRVERRYLFPLVRSCCSSFVIDDEDIKKEKPNGVVNGVGHVNLEFIDSKEVIKSNGCNSTKM